MTDREKTKLLTKVGFLFLERMGCREISTEINVHLMEKNTINLDAGYHYIIDIAGTAWEYLPPSEKDKFKVNKIDICRGIEVKVSRSDLKNGFIHHGCNFNYILAQKGLIKPSEIHDDIGIIEVDIDNFKVVPIRRPFYGYTLSGVEVIRNPKRKVVSDWLIASIKAQIGETLTNQAKRWLKDEFLSQNCNRNT